MNFFCYWVLNSLKTRVRWINLQRRKRKDTGKIAIRNAGMEQDDIARVLNVSQSVVSRPLREHRESGSIRKRNRSTLILECKELLLKHFGTWCIIWQPPDAVKGGCWDFERSKVPGRNPGIWSPLDSLDGQNMVLRDDTARPHCTCIIDEYKN